MPNEPLPTLWLRSPEDRDGFDQTIDAVIEVTPHWARKMLSLVHLAQGLRSVFAASSPLYEMQYWDSTPTWVIRDYETMEHGHILDDLYTALDEGEAVYIPAGPGRVLLPEDGGEGSYAHVECVLLHVQEDGICWSAHVKHSDITLRSADIPLRDLEAYANGLEPHSAEGLPIVSTDEGAPA